MNVQTKIGTIAFDVANTYFEPSDKSVPAGSLPEVSLASLIKTAVSSYYVSSWAVARAQDRLKAEWVAAGEDRKKSDAPKEVYSSESPGYADALASVIHDFQLKLLEGYEAGSREGGGDPVTDLADSLARDWAKVWYENKGRYVNPSKSAKRIAKDEDAMSDTRHGATFGEALKWFLSRPASKHVGNNGAWPFKVKKDESVGEACHREATARLAKPKASVAFGEGDDE